MRPEAEAFILGFMFCAKSAGADPKEFFESVKALANDVWPPFDPDTPYKKKADSQAGD